MVGKLERIARHDPHPRAPGGDDCGERDHVVLDDHVRLDLVEDLAQAVVDVFRAVDQRLPRRLDELPELLDRRLPEDRSRLADEVLPELTRLLLAFRRPGMAGRR
jgi:hypothetical protein